MSEHIGVRIGVGIDIDASHELYDLADSGLIVGTGFIDVLADEIKQFLTFAHSICGKVRIFRLKCQGLLTFAYFTYVKVRSPPPPSHQVGYGSQTALGLAPHRSYNADSIGIIIGMMIIIAAMVPMTQTSAPTMMTTVIMIITTVMITMITRS